jgi:putative peptidoglycan lipid II flippase
VNITSVVRRLRGSRAASSLVVMAGYVLSRVTGLLRDVVISAQFGTSGELGAYRAAFKITDLLYLVIIGGALGSSFIPVFVEVWGRDGAERAWRLASGVMTWALLVLAAASAALFVAAPLVTSWVYGGQGFSPADLELVTGLSRLFLLSPLLLGLGGLAMAALNARDRFTLPALAPVVYNLGIIAGALLLAPTLGVWGLAWGVVGGALLYLLIQLPGLALLGARLRLTLGRGLAELRTIARQMAPRVLGQSAAQVSIVVTAALTARLAAGNERIAGLDYAYQLMLLPFGIFSLSLSTVAFPKLARLHAEGRDDELAGDVRRTLAIILLLTIPAAVALWALAVPLVRLLFQRGEFGEQSLADTVAPLLGYASALPAFAAAEILIRAFYAMQRTWLPVLVGLLQVTLNLALGSAALLAGGDTSTLALCFSVANNVEALLLFALLARLLPGLWRSPALWRSVGAALGATALLALALASLSRASLPLLPSLALGGVYRWPGDFAPLALWLLAAGALGAALYGVAAAALGAREVRGLAARLRRKA